MPTKIFLVCLSVLFFGCANKNESHSSIEVPAQVSKLLDKNGCTACHRADADGIGPSLSRIAQQQYKSPEEILDLIRNPKPENWPDFRPMLPINISDSDGEKISKWLFHAEPTKTKSN